MNIPQPRTRLTRSILAAALTAACGGAAAMPTGGVVASGGATITNQGSTMVVINVPVGTSIINWTGFNLAKGEVAQFRGSDASGSLGLAASGTVNVLNRISGGQTTITGGLQQLVGGTTVMHNYMINPNGFVISGTMAMVGTSSLNSSITLTSTDIADAAFLAGTAPGGGQTFIGSWGPAIGVVSGSVTGVGTTGTIGVIPAAGTSAGSGTTGSGTESTTGTTTGSTTGNIELGFTLPAGFTQCGPSGLNICLSGSSTPLLLPGSTTTLLPAVSFLLWYNADGTLKGSTGVTTGTTTGTTTGSTTTTGTTTSGTTTTGTTPTVAAVLPVLGQLAQRIVQLNARQQAQWAAINAAVAADPSLNQVIANGIEQGAARVTAAMNDGLAQAAGTSAVNSPLFGAAKSFTTSAVPVILNAMSTTVRTQGVAGLQNYSFSENLNARLHGSGAVLLDGI